MSKLRVTPKNTVDGSAKPSIFDRLGSKKKSSKIAEAELQELKILSILAKAKSVLSKSDQSVTKQEKASMKKSRHGKKAKEKHKRSHAKPEASAIDSLDLGDLEGADEKFLQKRRLQLQRELRLQLKKEKKFSGKKSKKKVAVVSSESSASSSESSSSSSTSSSSYVSKKVSNRKRKASTSSESDVSPPKKIRSPTPSPPPPKIKLEFKKKAPSPRRDIRKPSVFKKSVSPHDRRSSPVKKKSPVPRRSKSRPRSPKHKVRPTSPSRRSQKAPDVRRSPPAGAVRTVRARTPEHRPRHTTPRQRPKGGLEKGGKILPVRSSTYTKEHKSSTVKRRSTSRSREDKEKELEKIREKRRREEKAREEKEAERREREREAERLKRDAERQREREEAIRRSRERERQKERDRVRDRDRSDRVDKHRETFDKKDNRKGEGKTELPSLLDIKADPPPARESGRRGYEERRPRRPDESFELRRPKTDLETSDQRRGRKHDFVREAPPWEGKESFREPPPSSWQRENKPRSHDNKWSGDAARESGWRESRERELREHHGGRRASPEFRSDAPPLMDSPSQHSKDVDVISVPPPAPPEPPGPPPMDLSVDLEEVLSDISDDADEILNQVDEAIVTQSVPRPPSPEPLPPALTQPTAEFFFDTRRPLLECLGDRGLDFEEISDEELEEEAKMGKGIMDVLGADWASLMSQTVRKTTSTATVQVTSSARRRWQPDALIARIGISRALAGDQFIESYLDRIHQEAAETAAKIKLDAEITDSVNDKETKINGDVKWQLPVKGSSVDAQAAVGQIETVQMKFLHTLPAVHATLAAHPTPSNIQRLLSSISTRALSARPDLALRRALCGLTSKETVQLGACDGMIKLAAVPV